MISPVADPPEPGPAANAFDAETDGPIAHAAAELRAALAMLTRLPVRGVSDARSGASGFAVVGAVLGLAGLVPIVVLGAAIPPGRRSLRSG